MRFLIGLLKWLLGVFIFLWLFGRTIIDMLNYPDQAGQILGDRLDQIMNGVLVWLGSPGPNGGDPRIVSVLFLLLLIWLVFFAVGKMRASAKKAFGKAEAPKKKTRRVKEYEEDESH